MQEVAHGCPHPRYAVPGPSGLCNERQSYMKQQAEIIAQVGPEVVTQDGEHPLPAQGICPGDSMQNHVGLAQLPSGFLGGVVLVADSHVLPAARCRPASIRLLTDGQLNEPTYRGSFNAAVIPINPFVAGLK